MRLCVVPSVLGLGEEEAVAAGVGAGPADGLLVVLFFVQLPMALGVARVRAKGARVEGDWLWQGDGLGRDGVVGLALVAAVVGLGLWGVVRLWLGDGRLRGLGGQRRQWLVGNNDSRVFAGGELGRIGRG
ncbi:hypothetical protein IWZ03DRAFT_365121 [Phyllosticta citriasiana]|uniref:Uncharacterized protein n=1 Tax=Phyllosticta citriasiana TaxID=595635 RepID=A0ABR1L1Z3_9PEZI